MIVNQPRHPSDLRWPQKSESEAEAFMANPSLPSVVVMVATGFGGFLLLAWVVDASLGMEWLQLPLALFLSLYLVQGLPSQAELEPSLIASGSLWWARTMIMGIALWSYWTALDLTGLERWVYMVAMVCAVVPLIWFPLHQIRQFSLFTRRGQLSTGRLLLVDLIVTFQVGLLMAAVEVWVRSGSIGAALLVTVPALLALPVGNVLMVGGAGGLLGTTEGIREEGSPPSDRRSRSEPVVDKERVKEAYRKLERAGVVRRDEDRGVLSSADSELEADASKPSAEPSTERLGRAGLDAETIERVVKSVTNRKRAPDEVRDVQVSRQEGRVVSDMRPESAFVALAARWEEAALRIDPEAALSGELDDAAFAAVLLALEWGESFSEDTRSQVRSCLSVLQARERHVWIDRLPWNLCLVPDLGEKPSEADAVMDLTDLLGHHQSSVRIWAMHLAWIIRPWIDTERALPVLLKNLADTLGGVSLAAGLAGALVEDEEKFWERAEAFEPDPRFEGQYHDRLERLREDGLDCHQVIFLTREIRLRKLIEEAAFSSESSVRPEVSLGDEPDRDEILRIVANHLWEEDQIGPIISGDGFRGGGYGPRGRWDGKWVVYLRNNPPHGPMVIRSSTIMAIDRESGEVTYYGSAHDEG